MPPWRQTKEESVSPDRPRIVCANETVLGLPSTNPFPNVFSGLVRFKTPKSVQRAYDKSVLEEVVVQDVAVQVKIVKEVGRRL